MSILPACCLTSSDLARLGNNLVARRRPRLLSRLGSERRESRRLLARLNRFLAAVNERIDQFVAPTAPRPG